MGQTLKNDFFFLIEHVYIISQDVRKQINTFKYAFLHSLQIQVIEFSFLKLLCIQGYTQVANSHFKFISYRVTFCFVLFCFVLFCFFGDFMQEIYFIHSDYVMFGVSQIEVSAVT